MRPVTARPDAALWNRTCSPIAVIEVQPAENRAVAVWMNAQSRT